MALINCKECGREVSNKADKCPHCGAKVKSNGNGCLWTIIVVALLYIMFSVFNPSSSSDNSNSSNSISHPNNFLAYNYAEDAVKKQLKSPSTAEFPRTVEKNEHVEYLGNGEYQINSWVDSQNSFGAMIRSNFSVIIVFDGNHVSYRDLKIQ